MNVDTGLVVSLDGKGGATITPIGCDHDDAMAIIRALARGMERTDTAGMTKQ